MGRREKSREEERGDEGGGKGTEEEGGGRRKKEENKENEVFFGRVVSNRFLTPCQPHRMTYGRSRKRKLEQIQHCAFPRNTLFGHVAEPLNKPNPPGRVRGEERRSDRVKRALEIKTSKRKWLAQNLKFRAETEWPD